MPWHALTLTGNGDIKPCCQLKGPQGNVHGGDTIPGALGSEMGRALRRDFLAGRRPESCVSCWDREASIGESRRTWFRGKFSAAIPDGAVYTEEADLPLVQADLNLSNFCNLKCRMCGSWASHQWIEEDRALGEISREFRREGRPERLKLFETDVDKIREILPRLVGAKRIDFKGGEPMLAKAHPELLELLIDEGFSSGLNLTYTSNGTVVNPRVLELLPKFRSVTVIFSIEGIGPLYQYIRGGRYEIRDLERNISRYDELGNVSIGFNVATQAYNVTRLRPLCEYLFNLPLRNGSAKDAFKYTMVNDPSYLSPFIIPEELRQKAVEDSAGEPELKSIHDRLLEARFQPDKWRLFRQFTNEVDRLRGESVLDVLPEFEAHWTMDEVV